MFAAAAAGVGLVGGIVAERLFSGDAIDKARDGDRWTTLHDDWLKEHPAPAGTNVWTHSTPQWKNAALIGGAALGVAGLAIAALGAGTLLGTGGSYLVR
jgi:hypothetical protein